MWLHRMWGGVDKSLCDGRSVRLLDSGRLNTDAGPDFFNAKVIIDDIEWVGNVEVHVKASDWKRHGHDRDAAYDNVILHVVGIDDCEVRRRDGSLIPQLLLPLKPEIVEKYSMLTEGLHSIRCSEYIGEMPDIMLSGWLESLACERLESKARRILDIIEVNRGDWEQACFVSLARALGFGLNSEPFEMLARSIPLNILHHHSDSLLQIEALLFGQAGMLDMSEHILDEYYQSLCREYYFLSRKYSLRPMGRHLWKYARTRPANFPHRRIALLARYVVGGFVLMRQIIEVAGDKDKLSDIFSIKLDGYWSEHISFDLPSISNPASLSKGSIELIMINLVAPLYFAYAMKSGDVALSERGVDLLMQLKPESNSIISQWGVVGLKADNAMRSQALIHLRKEYCDLRKCLHCRIGNHLMKMTGEMR